MGKKQGMPDLSFTGYPNRYVCDVLVISDVNTLKKLNKDIHNLKEARRALKKEVEELIDKRGKLEEAISQLVSKN